MPPPPSSPWHNYAYETETFRYWIDQAQISYSDMDGHSSITQNLIVERKDGAPIDPTGDDKQLMIKEDVIKPMGYEYDSASTYPMWEETARLRQVQMILIDSGRCRVELMFTTFYTVKPAADPTTTTSYLWLPATVDFHTSSRPSKIWRKGGTAAPVGSDSSADIGGTKVGTGADPLDVEVPVINVRLRFVQDATATGMVSQITTLQNYIGRVNSDTFLNWPAGQVKCDGLTMAHLENEYYEVIFEFSVDQYARHNQVPQADPDGEYYVNSSNQPLVVKWERESLPTAAFNTLYPDTTTKDIIEKGYWT